MNSYLSIRDDDDIEMRWRKLHLHILRIAVRDLQSRNETVRRQARAWINSGDLAIVCRHAGVHPEKVRNRATEL